MKIKKNMRNEEVMNENVIKINSFETEEHNF